MLSLFDTYVSSVLLHSYKIHAMHKGKFLKQVHLDSVKISQVLKAQQLMLWFTMIKVLPLQVTRKICFLNIFNLLNSKNYTLFNLNNILVRLGQKHMSNKLIWLKKELEFLGIGHKQYN